MIKKLKLKFTVLAAVSMLALMTVLVGTVNLLNYKATVSDTDRILSVVSREELRGRGDDTGFPPKNQTDGKKPPENDLPKGMSPEVPYESRYFTVTLTEEGEIVDTDISRIVSVDEQSARNYGKSAFSSKGETGFSDNFRYLKISEKDNVRITFLDCGRKFDAFYRFLWISSAIALICWAVASVIFRAVSEKIVRPIAESYEKQKRFITDAGHEMKTPLTIIGANADLLEADLGENECLSDIKKQTARLSSLTYELVYLAKMEETEQSKNLCRIGFPLSDLVSETAEQFRGPALAESKELTLSVSPNIGIKGDPEAFRRLLCLLMDNAVKYSPTGGKIVVELKKQGKSTVLSVFNTTKEPISEEGLSRVFDRFYRTDSSRNSETGGHGIGLSTAAAIVRSFGGKIFAASAGSDFKVTAVFPK